LLVLWAFLVSTPQKKVMTSVVEANGFFTHH
jgi:hypothetical protein